MSNNNTDGSDIITKPTTLVTIAATIAVLVIVSAILWFLYYLYTNKKRIVNITVD